MTRQAVRDLAPYQPGTSIEEVQKRFGLERIVKLASNENPLGSSPKALAALQHLDRLNLYFDDSHEELKAKLGARYGLGARNVICGHGSNELVSLAAQTLFEPGDEVVMATPSFSLYRLAARVQGAIPVEIPLRNGVHDLGAMRAAITEQTKAVIVCDPNNPTGTSVPAPAWDAWLEDVPDDVTLIVDQAYVEYASAQSFDAATLPLRRKNTLVLRTMSKIYGLAGVRFGYGYADVGLVGLMERVRLPFNVSRPAALAASAALDDDGFVRASVTSNDAGKAHLFAGFAAMGLHAYPTEANFVAVEVPGGAHAAYQDLLERGIIVRSGDALAMPGRLRITIGTPEQNALLLETMEALLLTWRSRS